jgi:hypothetical protein
VVCTVSEDDQKLLNRFVLWNGASWRETGSASLAVSIREGAAALSPGAQLFAAELESQAAIGVFETESGKSVAVIPVVDREDRRNGDYEARAAELHFNGEDALVVVQVNGVITQYDLKGRRVTKRVQVTSPIPE